MKNWKMRCMDDKYNESLYYNLVFVEIRSKAKIKFCDKVIWLCYYNLLLLDSFLFIKEVIITKVYPIVIILKLRPNNSFNPKSYRGVRRHFILLSQNLDLLLNLLPSEVMLVKNVI